MNEMTNNLMKDGYIKSDNVIEAFADIDRMEFVPQDLELQAEANIPLPIGYGQTISQPMTVAIMMELLDVQRGHNVLDIGSGSGWTTALLCHMVGEKGKVTAVEHVPELLEFGKNNVSKYGFIEKGIVEFHEGDGVDGYVKNAPYDRILVSASAMEVPDALEMQLKIGGKIVIPIHNRISYLKKNDEHDFYKEEYSGFSFVPLMQKSDD